MSFVASIHASGAPHHFERVAKNLLDKRRMKDHNSCDLRIQLKKSTEMVHSVIMCAHSITISGIIEKSKLPYPKIDMKNFEEDSVRRVIDWMYTGTIGVPTFSLRDDLLVASHLKIPILLRQFEKHLKDIAFQGSVINALNIASAKPFSVTEDTMLYIVLQLFRNTSTSDTNALTLQSIFAVTASLLDAEQKVPLVNMVLKWIRVKKIDRAIVGTIVNSIVVRDVSYYQMSAIKYSLKKYLEDPNTASKTLLAISQSGEIVLNVTNEDYKRASQSNSNIRSRVNSSECRKPIEACTKPVLIRSASHIHMLNTMPDPFHTHIVYPQSRNPALRTKSEIEDLKELKDPFEKSEIENSSSKRSNSKAFCRPSNDGYPKVFTKSEVDMLQDMKNPFIKSSSSSTSQKSIPARFPVSDSKYKNKMTEKDLNVIKFAETNLPKPCHRSFTKSEMQMIATLPNPFTPVVMPPVQGCVSNYSGKSEAVVKEKSEFGMSPDYRPDFVISPKKSKDTAVRLKRSPSEIQEINNLKSISSSTSLKKNEQPKAGNKKIERSRYLYMD